MDNSLIFFASNPIADAYRTSDLFGKTIFIALFFLSIMTWIIFLQKIIQARNAKKGKEEFFEILEENKNKLFEMREANGRNPFSYITRTLRTYVIPVINEQGWINSSELQFIEASLYRVISDESKKLKNNLSFLSITVSLAPFLGLLGTVWGILITFGQLQKGIAAASSQVVMGGLSMALGTTVCGLVVAIPALVAYSSLKAKAVDLTVEMEDYSKLLLAYVVLKYGAKPKS